MRIFSIFTFCRDGDPCAKFVSGVQIFCLLRLLRLGLLGRSLKIGKLRICQCYSVEVGEVICETAGQNVRTVLRALGVVVAKGSLLSHLHYGRAVW